MGIQPVKTLLSYSKASHPTDRDKAQKRYENTKRKTLHIIKHVFI